jgi:biopolymer transport protein ExbD
MAMNVGAHKEDEVLMEINTTPLIDVMLVLLVMLIITIPIQTHAVKLNMPKGVPPVQHEPVVINLDIDAQGKVFWNGQWLQDESAVETQFQAIAQQSDQDEVHLRPNKEVTYDHVARVLSAAQRIGVNKIGLTGHEQFLDATR